MLDSKNLGIEYFVELPFDETERDIELFFNPKSMVYTGVDIATNEAWQWQATKNPLTLTLEEQVNVHNTRTPWKVDDATTAPRCLRDPWMIGYGVDLNDYTKVW